MNLFKGMDISASALSTQRLRMDIVASNISNAETTRGKYINGKWQPYTRKMVVVEPITGNRFNQMLNNSIQDQSNVNGVKVTSIVEDKAPYKKEYNPSHPDADEKGFVYYPNVNLLTEMVDMASAERAYQANVTALNSTKAMMMKSLEILR